MLNPRSRRNSEISQSRCAESTLKELGIGNWNGDRIVSDPRKVDVDESLVANISNAGVKHLNNLHNLKSLVICGTRITDEGLKELKGLTELRQITIGFIKGGITEGCLLHLGQFPKLDTLVIVDSIFPAQPFDASLIELKRLSGLESLTIVSQRVTDSGMQHLGELRQLRKLTLTAGIAPMLVTDRGLKHIARLGRLEDLDISHTCVTKNGVETLRGMLPKTKIVGPAR